MAGNPSRSNSHATNTTSGPVSLPVPPFPHLYNGNNTRSPQGVDMKVKGADVGTTFRTAEGTLQKKAQG